MLPDFTCVQCQDMGLIAVRRDHFPTSSRAIGNLTLPASRTSSTKLDATKLFSTVASSITVDKMECNADKGKWHIEKGNIDSTLTTRTNGKHRGDTSD